MLALFRPPWFFIIAFSFLMVSNGQAGSDSQRELVILNWADYIEESLIPAFESRCNCKVRQVYFETDDHRDELMLAGEGAGYDVIILNGLMIDTYRKRGWLDQVPGQGMDNLKFISPRWARAFEGAPGYAIPYFWGTMGIAYRKDLLSEPVTSWSKFFRPAEELRGKIRLINSARDLMAGSLKAIGSSINETDPKAIKEAEKLLLAQRPYVGSYTYLSLAEDSALVTGDALAALMFSGDALMIKEYNKNIEYVLPEEGGQIWIDHLAVPARSASKALAWSFINFLNEPKNAANNAEYVYYATPNMAAEKRLPREFLANPIIYPSAKTLKNSEYYKTLPPRVERMYSDVFSRVVQ
jgi:spermidine/putrescine transport system substrate-binding protein